MKNPLLLFAAAAFLLAACEDILFDVADHKKTDTSTTTPDPEEPENTAVTGIRLNLVEAALVEGAAGGNGTLQLTAAVLPAEAADKTVLWVSMNNGVAAVDNTGLVTARGAGKAIIMAITEDGGKTASCVITVSASGRNNVSGVSANAADSLINLSWENPADADFYGAEITWVPADGPAQPVTLTGGETGYQITGLTNGTLYTVRICALYAGGAKSGVTAVTGAPDVYVLNAPAAVPAAGAIASPFTITLALYIGTPSGTEIWYTTDGADPQAGQTGALYTAPFPLPLQGVPSATLKAIAHKDGYADSPVLTAVYTAAP